MITLKPTTFTFHTPEICSTPFKITNMRVTSCQWGPELQGVPAPPLSAVLRPGKRSDNSDCARVPHCITLNLCQPQCSATVIPARVLPGLQAGAELRCACFAPQGGAMQSSGARPVGRAGKVQCAAAKRQNPTMNHAT